jgi:hypothetical protein
MTRLTGKSKRRRQLKRRREQRATMLLKMPELPEFPSVVPDAVLNTVVLAIIAAFSVGGVITVGEGHGEVPGGVHHPTQSIAKLAAAATTTTGSSGLFKLYDSAGIDRYLSVTPPPTRP